MNKICLTCHTNNENLPDTGINTYSRLQVNLCETAIFLGGRNIAILKQCQLNMKSDCTSFLEPRKSTRGFQCPLWNIERIWFQCG